MLARLDEDLSPTRSSVNQEGNLLRVHGQDVDPVRVLAIVEEMGSIAEPIDVAPDVDRWFGTADTDDLSQQEALVLAERWTRELADEGIIGDAERVTEPLRVTLLASFRVAAQAGTIDDMPLDPTALRNALDEAEVTAVLQWMEQKLGGFRGHPR